MNEIASLLAGFSDIFNVQTLLWCLVGVTLGTLIGALPGLGSVTGVAILLPLTFELDPISSLILLTGIYQGAMYGGRISSILINVPGEPAAVVTTFDGYPMTRQGKAGYALSLSAVASFVGGMLGIIGLVFLTPPLAKFALLFGPPEYFLLMLLALLLTGGLGAKNAVKNYLMLALGLVLAMVGRDPITSADRFTFGFLELWEGVSFVVVAIGVFGISEVLLMLDKKQQEKTGMLEKFTFKNLFPSVHQFLKNSGSILRGSIIGFIIGVLPGAGGTISSFLSYGVEHKLSKTPEKFGKGADQGLSGPEASTSSAMNGSLIPLFSMGIPGSATAAILLGALIMLGLKPGPSMLNTSGDIVWAVIAGLIVGNVLLLILNTAFVPMFTYIIRVATPYLVSVITVFCIIGVYFLNNSIFDIGLMILFGIFGYFLRKYGFSLAGMLLALILGGMIETNFRQALLISNNNYFVFFERPISLISFVSLVIFIGYTVYKELKNRALVKHGKA